MHVDIFGKFEGFVHTGCQIPEDESFLGPELFIVASSKGNFYLLGEISASRGDIMEILRVV